MNINVLEIRNYLFKPHTLEHFIDYFEEHFIFSQQDANMHILGQFRLVGEPDRFVWMRGFPDMHTRLEGLRSFYGGPVWKKYRQVANEMMLECHDVHLLRPLFDTNLTCGVTAETIAADLTAGTISPYTGMIAVDFYHARPGERESLIDSVVSIYENEPIQRRGYYVAEMSENQFTSLPAIQDENELVVITAYESEDVCRATRAKLTPYLHDLSKPSETYLLNPTLRSPLRYLPLA